MRGSKHPPPAGLPEPGLPRPRGSQEGAQCPSRGRSQHFGGETLPRRRRRRLSPPAICSEQLRCGRSGSPRTRPAARELGTSGDRALPIPGPRVAAPGRARPGLSLPRPAHAGARTRSLTAARTRHHPRGGGSATPAACAGKRRFDNGRPEGGASSLPALSLSPGPALRGRGLGSANPFPQP